MSSHNRMQLPDQLLKKVRILTDKPISPILNKQLLPMLLHQNLPLQKTIPILTCKYRSDLLNHLLQNNRYPSQHSINTMLTHIQNNIISYKLPEILQLYIHVLTKIDDDKKLLEIGYYDLIKLSIKLANLEIKERLFQVLVSNFQFFFKRKCKKVVMAIVANFVDVFTKFLIYVPSYVSLAQLTLQIDRNSKQILNKDHPQRQPQLQQIFTDLSSKQLSAISVQTTLILKNTKDKLNNYTLHRNCLNVLKKIGQLLNNYKIKESQLYFTQIDVNNVIRIISMFMDRKGTIDQAKFAKAVWDKRWEGLRIVRDMKTEKYVAREFQGPLFIQQKDIGKKMLIQDVISMANNYRLKYQVAPAENQQASASRIVAVSNNFLKKGIGIGGGRTYLLNEKHERVYREQKSKNKRLYDDLLHKCFEQYEKDLQYKSFVDPKIVKQSKEMPINEQGQWRIEQPVGINLHNSRLSVEEVDNLPAFSGNRSIINEEQTKLNMSKQTSIFQDDEEIQQINNLIQLAYSYRFS